MFSNDRLKLFWAVVSQISNLCKLSNNFFEYSIYLEESTLPQKLKINFIRNNIYIQDLSFLNLVIFLNIILSKIGQLRSRKIIWRKNKFWWENLETDKDPS